jgi:hypothetical protein
LLMIFIGTLGAIGSGAAFPVMMLFFSNIVDSFSSYEYDVCNLTSLDLK